MNNSDTAAPTASVEQTSSDRQGIMVRLVLEEKPDTEEPLSSGRNCAARPTMSWSWMWKHLMKMCIMYMDGEVWTVSGPIRPRRSCGPTNLPAWCSTGRSSMSGSGEI